MLSEESSIPKELGIKCVLVEVSIESAYRGIELCARTVRKMKNCAATKQQLMLLFEELIGTV